MGLNVRLTICIIEMFMYVFVQDVLSTWMAAGTESSNRRAPAQTQRELPAAIRSAFIVGVRIHHLKLMSVVMALQSID